MCRLNEIQYESKPGVSTPRNSHTPELHTLLHTHTQTHTHTDTHVCSHTTGIVSVCITRLIVLKELYLLLQQIAVQQSLDPLVQPGQDPHKRASSQRSEQRARAKEERQVLMNAEILGQQ